MCQSDRLPQLHSETCRGLDALQHSLLLRRGPPPDPPARAGHRRWASPGAPTASGAEQKAEQAPHAASACPAARTSSMVASIGSFRGFGAAERCGGRGRARRGCGVGRLCWRELVGGGLQVLGSLSLFLVNAISCLRICNGQPGGPVLGTRHGSAATPWGAGIPPLMQSTRVAVVWGGFRAAPTSAPAPAARAVAAGAAGHLRRCLLKVVTGWLGLLL